MRWPWLLAAAAMVGVGAGAITVYRPALPLVEAAEAAPAAGLVVRGAQLAALGNCAGCHTGTAGAYAGGVAIRTPFGVVYGSNITPDAETGIGGWSAAAFGRAMREGVGREGEHLYPAFPYEHYQVLDDGEMAALWAFVRTRTAVRAAVPANELVFPLGFRPLLAGWKLLFGRERDVAVDPARSAEWNRGRVLVAGLGHCGGCHTPRNALGAEKADEPLFGGEAEGWDAPPLMGFMSWASSSWSEEDLFRYLRTGMDGRHGAAGGPMAHVVRGLRGAPDGEVRAMAVFLASLQMGEGREAGVGRPWAEAAVAAGGDEGAVVFAGACAVCHAAGTPTAQAGYPPVLRSTAMHGPSARNAIRAVLEGVPGQEEDGAPLMPGYRASLSDGQVAAVLAFMRAGVPGVPAWGELVGDVRRAREE